MMAQITLGIVLEPLGLPPRRAFERAAEIGAACVQIDAAGDLHPDKLSTTGRREVRTILRTCNLQLAAVQVPLRRGLNAVEHQQERIDHLKKIMDLAAELGTSYLVVPCPVISPDGSPTAIALHESLTAITQYGSHLGVMVCLEAGIDPAEKLKDFLVRGYPAGIAFDPSNFLANGHDPVKAFQTLSSTVQLMQARDVRRGDLRGGAREVAVGAGDVDWLSLFASLSASDIPALPVVVEREEGPQRANDVESGLQFLRRFAPIQDTLKS